VCLLPRKEYIGLAEFKLVQQQGKRIVSSYIDRFQSACEFQKVLSSNQMEDSTFWVFLVLGQNSTSL
jgi:hypothetical protein